MDFLHHIAREGDPVNLVHLVVYRVKIRYIKGQHTLKSLAEE